MLNFQFTKEHRLTHSRISSYKPLGITMEQPQHTEDVENTTVEIENRTPVKSRVTFEQDPSLLQSPRVFFSDYIASPRARREKDENDSFQISLAGTTSSGLTLFTPGQRGFNIARAYACLGVVLVFLVILYSLENREGVRDKLWILICFCGSLFIMLLQVVWVLMVWGWFITKRKSSYKRLNNLSTS